MPTLICEVEEGETGHAVEFAVTVREHMEPSYRLHFMAVDDDERVFCRSVSSAEIEQQIEALLGAESMGSAPSEDDLAIEVWAEGGPRPACAVVWSWLLSRMVAMQQQQGDTAGVLFFRTEGAAAARRNLAARRMDALSRTDGGSGAVTGVGGGGSSNRQGLASTFAGHEQSAVSLTRSDDRTSRTQAQGQTQTEAQGKTHAAAKESPVRGGTSGNRRKLKEHEVSEERFRMNADLEHTRYNLKLLVRQRALERKHAAAYQNATNKKYATMRQRQAEERADHAWSRDKIMEVLLMHQQMETMEQQKRQEGSAAHRDHQRHMWSFAPFKSRQLIDKSKRTPGPYFGSGPVAPDDMNTHRVAQTAVWDMNGRRHARSAAEGLRRENAVQSALKIIREVAQTNTVHGLDLKKPFRQFDRNNSGSLDRAELQSALQMMGANLSNAQLDALMEHFDPDGSGEVDYSEFMWAFFNQRQLLRDWKVHTQGKSARQIHEMFYEHLKFGKALSKKQFKAALDKILRKEHTDSEIELLLDQIDVDQDGSVNVSEFTAFMHRAGESAATAAAPAAATAAVTKQPRDSTAPSSTRELNTLLDTMLAQSRELQGVLAS